MDKALFSLYILNKLHHNNSKLLPVRTFFSTINFLTMSLVFYAIYSGVASWRNN